VCDKLEINEHAYHTYDTYLQVYANSYPFLVWVHLSPFIVIWWVAFLKDYLFSFSIYFFHIYTLWFFLVFWTKVPFTSRNGLEPVGWDWWFFIKSLLFCSVTKKKHEISSEYLLKLHSLYCCCGTIFEAWKVKNVIFNIWYHVIFSPHNLSYEVILKGAELYSLTDLKSYNLKCNQS
jgi:hypothetical protein